ncbi:MAG: helix-turn-helix domain-containing protein [Proteobacteria bacterium]|nr:helix-turn-helix domain-containing protein [Pseudomonadota bacterium]
MNTATGIGDDSSSTEGISSDDKALAEELRIAQGERVRAARKRSGLTIGHLHRKSGLHPNTIGRIERGEMDPSSEHLIALARGLGLSPRQLSAFSSDAGGDLLVSPAITAVSQHPFVYVPHFDIQASAGVRELFNQIELVKAMRPFDQSYIRGDLGISHDAIALISVVGDSMEPRLSSGDTVLVDLRAGSEMFSDGIHVIRLDEALLVKQVQRLPGRVFKIRSLNSDYESFEIRATEEEDRDFAIIGRVRWGGINIK